MGVAVGALHVQIESGTRDEVAFGSSAIADPVEADHRVADLALGGTFEAVTRRVVARELLGGRTIGVIRVQQPALHPLRHGIAQHHRNQVERVRVVFDQVGPGVHRREPGLADLAALDRRAQPLETVVMAAHGPPVEGDAVGLQGRTDAVGLGQRCAEPLFRVDAAHPVLGGEDDRLRAGEAGRGDADDVRFFPLDHRPVVEVGVGDAEALHEPFQPLGAAVRDGHDLYLVDGRVGAEVAVRPAEAARRNLVLDQPAHAAGADDRCAIGRSHCSLLAASSRHTSVARSAHQ